MRTLLTTLLFVSALWLCVGCNQTKAPDALKNLVPVTITVTDGSNPVEKVSVRFSGKGSQGAFACVGTTDAKGVATIQSTSGSYTGKGVPAGTYSVVLIGSVGIPEDLQPREEDQDNPAAAAAKQAKRDEFLAKNQLVPKSLTTAAETKIELTVVEGKGESLTIDLSQYR